GATWIWHVPAFYEAALRSDSWHYLEHVTFVVSGLLFWWPVVQPYPSRPQCSRWLLIPYLLLADLLSTPLAALLTYSGSVLYPHYLQAPRLMGISAREDQAVAGLLMWIVGSLAYLVPLVWIAGQALYGRGARSLGSRPNVRRLPSGQRISLPV